MNTSWAQWNSNSIHLHCVRNTERGGGSRLHRVRDAVRTILRIFSTITNSKMKQSKTSQLNIFRCRGLHYLNHRIHRFAFATLLQTHPFIEIFTFGQHNSQTKVSTSKRSRRLLHQLILVRSFWYMFLRFKSLWRTSTAEKFKGNIVLLWIRYEAAILG